MAVSTQAFSLTFRMPYKFFFSSDWLDLNTGKIQRSFGVPAVTQHWCLAWRCWKNEVSLTVKAQIHQCFTGFLILSKGPDFHKTAIQICNRCHSLTTLVLEVAFTVDFMGSKCKCRFPTNKKLFMRSPSLQGGGNLCTHQSSGNSQEKRTEKGNTTCRQHNVEYHTGMITQDRKPLLSA